MRRPTAASSSTRSGAATRCAAIARSACGRFATQRRCRNSAISGASGGTFSPSICCITCQIDSRSIDSSALSSSSVRAASAGSIAPGPVDSSVSDSHGRSPDADSTASRTTWPPNECPSRCSGPSAPSSADSARTSAPSARTEYASGSAGPPDSYWPRWSTATVRNPASASGSSSAMKSSLLPVNPGTSSAVPRTGPAGSPRSAASPASRTARTHPGSFKNGGVLMSPCLPAAHPTTRGHPTQHRTGHHPGEQRKRRSTPAASGPPRPPGKRRRGGPTWCGRALPGG